MAYNLMKITYHRGSDKVHAYLNTTPTTFTVLKSKIDMILFEQRSESRCEVRIYWIDDDDDEIEIVNQCDFDVFLLEKQIRQHLHVAPKGEKVNGGVPRSTSGAGIDVDPTNFVIHERVECDGCNVGPIIGFRYKCIQCPNFDLCQNCEGKHMHSEHMMLRMPNENCPTLVDSLITGRWGRRNKRQRSFCAYGPGHASQGEENVGDNMASSDCKERKHHSGRKHPLRQFRHSFLNQFYDVMQDLAEGGASSRANESTAKAAADDAEKKTADDAKKTADDAKKTAESAEVAAAIAAEVAAKAAEVASHTAHKIATAYANGAYNVQATAPASEAKQTDEQNNVNEATNTSTKIPPSSLNISGPNAEPPNTKNAENNASEQTTPVTPSLESLAKFMDPKYMKTGIEILNNFSEMFAKMLDPSDGAGMSCPFAQGAAFQPSPNTTHSAMSSHNVSMNANKGETAEKASTSASAAASIDSSSAAASIASTSVSASTSMSASATESRASVNAVEKSQSPERRPSQNEDNDWQLIDKNISLNESFDNVSNSAAQTTGPASTTNGTNDVSTEVNYEQLSKDLKAHVEDEKKRATKAEKEVGKATADIPKPQEKPQVPIIYHHDQNINNAIRAMMAMGFSNEGAWLTQLLESVNGNIPEALDLMTVAQRNNQ